MDNSIFSCFDSGEYKGILWVDLRPTHYYNSSQNSCYTGKVILDFLVSNSINDVTLDYCAFHHALSCNLPLGKTNFLEKEFPELRFRTYGLSYTDIKTEKECVLFLNKAQVKSLISCLEGKSFIEYKCNVLKEKKTKDRNTYIEQCREKLKNISKTSLQHL
ncbi:hypothetical protein Pm5461_109 [Proteus phage vB_PmiM_Pm5461]|uniref:Uncharacterized protein n=1 Tax=Proteus phage vB_PmiM_Pm5461 TaxID=1636250 RepID=A0A0G2SS73_9CAUD|nr:hypothetical protein AVT59_gp112 [Proteus phage vB_PmiM_Pm5461]AKA61974.1 hypothetical protein Pm5461_109 [Proteus phage vB_PmiM_Pm5461]